MKKPKWWYDRFPFTNFLPFETPMVEDSFEYITPEHYFQAQKSHIFADKAWIANANTPGDAKARGRSVKLRSDWSEVREEVMEKALRHKFAEGTGWRTELEEFRGEIVEWNTWHDNIWGICTCPTCGSRGSNLLGKLLMKLREEFSDG